MKKYTTIFVSAILAVISLFMSLPLKKDAVKAGAGFGKNTDIETIDDMYSFLDYITNYKIVDKDKNELKGTDTPALMLMSATSDSDKDDIFNTKHSSATIYESTFSESTAYRLNEYDWVDGESSSKFNRELTIYMTEDATYFVSKGTLDSRYLDYNFSGANQLKASVYFDFDMQIYIEEDTAMMKINQFVMSELEDGVRENTQIKDKYIGKWIQLPPETAMDFFEDINDQNGDTLGALKSYLGEEIDVNPDKNKSIYTIEEESDNSLTTITLDMSDTKKPYTEFCIKESSKYRDVNALDTIACYNIDNTVINVKQKPDVIIRSEDEMEKIFSTTEQRED